VQFLLNVLSVVEAMQHETNVLCMVEWEKQGRPQVACFGLRSQYMHNRTEEVHESFPPKFRLSGF
jgi:hypothetical protein